jgi:predicted Zn finger-like uncharacterized protein
MKIVCGSCGAKYSIADEKVQGKVFKIRCKKCSNVIVVKGNEEGDATMSSSVGNSVASEWYVVVDGEQVGPVAVSEIDAYYLAGRINSDTFAWKDGLTDWVALSKLDEFAHLSELGGAGPEEATQISDDFSLYQKQVNADADETSVMSTSSDFGSASGGGAFSAFESSMAEEEPNGFTAGFSDFGSSEAQSDFGYAKAGGTSEDSGFESGGLFSSFDEPAAGPQLQSSGNAGGMFASFDSDANNDDFLGLSSAEPASRSRTKSSVGGAAAMANASVGSELVGKRNENSVLFSLSSLDQVQAVGASASKPGADVPVTDGSGLIDIRALASAHKSMMSSGGGNDGGGVDPFTTGTMAMPALMPMGSHRSNKPLIIGGIVGGVFLFGVVGLLAYVVFSKDDVAPVGPTTIVEYRDRPVEETSEADKASAKEAAEAAKQALAGNEPVVVANNDTAEAKDPKDTKSGSRRTPDKKSEPEVAAPKEEDKPTPKKEEPKGDGIDRLLNSIDEGTAQKETKKSTPKKEESSSSSGGKDKLDKSDVLNTIKAYSGRINTCYKSANANNLSGTMKVKFSIKPNGSVTNTEVVSGNFAGTDVGRCVQKAVGGMKFPSTSATDNVPVTYPFKLE